VWLKLNVHGNFLIRCNAIRELNTSASLSVAQARSKLFCAEADRCEQYGAFTVIVNLITVMFSALLSSPFGLFQCRHPLPVDSVSVWRTQQEGASTIKPALHAGVYSIDGVTMKYEHWLELAVLRSVQALSDNESRKLTFGQIYMELVRICPSVPSIAQCVMAVDVLVREGLIVSEKVLDADPRFPYTQHLITGLTEVGAASLSSLEGIALSQVG
jgi:hypothetical protein